MAVSLFAFLLVAWLFWKFFLGPSYILGKIQDHNLRAVEWYCRTGVSPNSDVWLQGGVFHCVVASGDTNIVLMMIKRGADINRIDGYGGTPLDVAVEFQKVEMIRLLVSQGADVSRRDRKGRTALELAEQENLVGSREYLREFVSGMVTNK